MPWTCKYRVEYFQMWNYKSLMFLNFKTTVRPWYFSTVWDVNTRNDREQSGMSGNYGSHDELTVILS